MGQYRFVSNRTVKNKKGEQTGSLRVLVKTGSNTAETKYKCPECLHEEQAQFEWVRPFIVSCSKCKVKIKIPKLKEELKKEQAAEKKAKQKAMMEQAKSLAESN